VVLRRVEANSCVYRCDLKVCDIAVREVALLELVRARVPSFVLRRDGRHLKDLSDLVGVSWVAYSAINREGKLLVLNHGGSWQVSDLDSVCGAVRHANVVCALA
jgi:hypothetical protein